MPDTRSWKQQIKGGLGPLLRVMHQFNECLVVLIKENNVGQRLTDTTSIERDSTGKVLQVRIGTTTIQLYVHRSRRGLQLSEQVRFTESSVAWVFAEDRTDEELVALQNAIRASLGIPPWDPIREPWVINQ